MGVLDSRLLANSDLGSAVKAEDATTTASVPSCMCLEEGYEPCTAEDLVNDWKGVIESLKGEEGLCSSPIARKPLLERDGSGLPDSRVFFGLAGLGRLHCPLPSYTTDADVDEPLVTFTQFSTENELKAFCAEGLNYWEGMGPLSLCRSGVLRQVVLICSVG